MSANPTDHSVSEQPVLQEPEGLSTGRAVATAIVFGVVFFFAVLWSVRMFKTEERALAPQGTITVPGEIGKPEIGIVNQRLFELQLEAEEKRNQQRKQLNGYGWTDREKQIIHIPIDRAMEKLATEAKK
jgi:hypothetical protein